MPVVGFSSCVWSNGFGVSGKHPVRPPSDNPGCSRAVDTLDFMSRVAHLVVIALPETSLRISDISMTKTRLNPPAIGPLLQKLRKERSLTLDKLAAASGVSRSMLSQIERGEANPTLATVWHLSQALGIEIIDFVGGQSGERRANIEVTAASFVPEIRSDDGKCVMRILSPANEVGRTELYLLKVAPGGTLESSPHARGAFEHLSVLQGELVVGSGDATAVIAAGGIARYPADVPHVIRNTGIADAEALLVVTLPV